LQHCSSNPAGLFASINIINEKEVVAFTSGLPKRLEVIAVGKKMLRLLLLLSYLKNYQVLKKC
jgi:hypothetical protein